MRDDYLTLRLADHAGAALQAMASIIHMSLDAASAYIHCLQPHIALHYTL